MDLNGHNRSAQLHSGTAPRKASAELTSDHVNLANADDVVSPQHAAARRYASLGYFVFPLAPNAKVPKRGSGGLLDATTDIRQIDEWWMKEPNCNVGIRTDGLVVIDPDLIDKETANPQPNLWLSDEPEKARLLAGAPTQRTWSGGRQHFFREPPSRHYRNTEGDLARNVDTRAHGGYVVAAPSFVRKNGRQGHYQWVPGCELETPPDALPVVPDWLVEQLDAIEANRGKKLASSSKKQAARSGTNLIPKGKRNSTLTSLAGTMRRRGMDQAEIQAALTETAKRCESDPDDLIDPSKIAASVMRYDPAALLVQPENRTDVENGRRFVREHGRITRYVATWGKWCIYDGKRWKIDDQCAVEALAKETSDRVWIEVLAEVPKAIDPRSASALLNWGRYTASTNGIAHMLAAARSEVVVVVSHRDLDADPWLLNVQNGTIDLRTGQLRPHHKLDLITKLSHVIYDPQADCPRWRQFVKEIMASDDAMVVCPDH